MTYRLRRITLLVFSRNHYGDMYFALWSDGKTELLFLKYLS